MAVVSTSERLAMDDGDDGGGAALQSTLVLAVLVIGARYALFSLIPLFFFFLL